MGAQKRTQRNVRCRSAELHRRSLRSLPPLSSLCALVHHIERPSPLSQPPSSFTAAPALLSPLPIRCVPTRNTFTPSSCRVWRERRGRAEQGRANATWKIHIQKQVSMSVGMSVKSRPASAQCSQLNESYTYVR